MASNIPFSSMQHPQEQLRCRIDEQGGYIPQNGTSSFTQMPGMGQIPHTTMPNFTNMPQGDTSHNNGIPPFYGATPTNNKRAS